MVEIIVKGKRGSGKTITAIRIVKMLREAGMECEYKGETIRSTDVINGILDGEYSTDTLAKANEVRQFVVVDTHKAE